jgi:hypothetical protein
MDDGASGEFSTIFTSEHLTTFTVTANIQRGRYYRFRYRAKNVIGYSEYSDVSYIQAVAAPTKPATPKFISATDTSITIQLFESADTNGVDVASYEIWRDAGNDLTSAFTLLSGVGSYNGYASTYQLTVAADGLGAASTLYRIKVRAKNADAVYSEYSDSLVVALGSVPTAPSTPVKDDAASGPQ